MEKYAHLSEIEADEPVQPIIDDTPIIDDYQIPKSITTSPSILKFITDLIYQMVRQFWWISIFNITTLTIDHYIVHFHKKILIYGFLAIVSIIAIFLPNKIDFSKL